MASTMPRNVSIRFAQRSEVSTLARVTNAANAQSALHRRMAAYQDEYPLDYYQWRLNITRQRFATPDIRTIVAADSDTGEILGLASWAVEGRDTALYKQWVGESTWADWVESKLVWVEQTWRRYVLDKSLDRKFLNDFVAAFLGTDKPTRPACLHCHLIVVDPTTQSKGVGRTLIDWGKDLATREELPLFLEATLEATGFYEKGGFARLSKDLVVSPKGQEPICIPMYVWEGPQREGRWLERDESYSGADERWNWRADVLPK